MRFWVAPFYAFHSEAPYVAAARRWRGLAMGYLLVVVSLVWLPTALQLHRGYEWVRTTYLPAVLADMPTVEIRDGQARIAGGGPVRLTGPGDDVVAILDPAARASDLEGTPALVLLTRDVLVVDTFQGPRALDLDSVGSVVLTPSTVQAAADVALRWLAALTYPVGALASFVYRFVQALLFGLLAAVMARTFGASLSYAAAVRLTAVALTPVMVLELLQALTRIAIPAWWLVALATTLIYLYFGVRALTESAGGEAAGPA